MDRFEGYQTLVFEYIQKKKKKSSTEEFIKLHKPIGCVAYRRFDFLV